MAARFPQSQVTRRPGNFNTQEEREILMVHRCTRSRAACLTLILAIVLVPGGLRAAAPPPTDVNGRLFEVQKVRVLRIWGTPRQRGYAHGYLLAKDIIGVLQCFVSKTSLSGGVAGYEQAMQFTARAMEIAPAYEAELRGILAGVEARLGKRTIVPALQRKLRYEDLVTINCIPDFGKIGCSSFAAWGTLTRKGHTIAGRNLDWRRGKGLAKRQIAIAHIHPPNSGAVDWLSITWPGFIGCLTGMNAEGVTVSMHDAEGGPPAMQQGFIPRAFTLRDAIEAAHAKTAKDDVAAVLRARPCAVGNIIPVAVPHRALRPAAWVFEYDGRLDKDGGVTVRSAKAEPGDGADALQSADCLACTNDYRLRAEVVPSRRYEKIAYRLNVLAKNERVLNVKGAWQILRSIAKPRKEDARLTTYHSVVFEPNLLRLQVAFSKRGRGAPASRPVELDIAKLLKPEPTAAGHVTQH
ncbi:MAG: C45 family autoproteolytic acyltransferase/hydrolase [Phycisphaerae bacterium]